MPKRERSPESSTPPASINDIKTVIEQHIKRKMRNPSPETTPWDKDAKFLTDTALTYEVELQRLRAQIARMRPELERLKLLKEPESQFKMLGLGSERQVNQIEFLQDQVRLLSERSRKLKNETNILKDNVAVLGRMARLMWRMTKLMARDSDKEMNDKDKIEVLRDHAMTLGGVAQLMFDMTLLIATQE